MTVCVSVERLDVTAISWGASIVDHWQWFCNRFGGWQRKIHLPPGTPERFPRNSFSNPLDTMRFGDHQGIPQSVFFCLPHKGWCRRTTIAVSDRGHSHLTVRAENSMTFAPIHTGKTVYRRNKGTTTLNLFGNKPCISLLYSSLGKLRSL